MARHQKESQAEPLCLQFDFGQDKDGTVYIHEEYAGAGCRFLQVYIDMM